jgi:hypothetical protein
VEQHLIWEPQGELKVIADGLNQRRSRPDEVYRGDTEKSVKILKSTGKFVSTGAGHTRDVVGAYVSADIHLAGAFALRRHRDTGNGAILVLDRRKLPNLQERDPGNFTVDFIPLISVKEVIFLKEFVLSTRV